MTGYLVPTVLEQTAQGERAFDLYSRLLADRVVFLGTEIDDASANLVIGQLLHLAAEGCRHGKQGYRGGVEVGHAPGPGIEQRGGVIGIRGLQGADGCLGWGVLSFQNRASQS